MYFHIGQNTVLDTSEIIGIFDLDNSSHGKDTRNFLHKHQEKKLLTVLDDQALPRSFVLTEQEVYLTPISTATLVKRAKNYKNSIL